MRLHCSMPESDAGEKCTAGMWHLRVVYYGVQDGAAGGGVLLQPGKALQQTGEFLPDAVRNDHLPSLSQSDEATSMHGEAATTGNLAIGKLVARNLVAGNLATGNLGNLRRSI